MEYDDYNYTPQQRLKYWKNWLAAALVVCFLFAFLTFFGFAFLIEPGARYDSFDKTLEDWAWVLLIILLPLVWVYWSILKKNMAIDDEIKEAARAATEKRLAERAEKDAAAKKKWESGQD